MVLIKGITSPALWILLPAFLLLCSTQLQLFNSIFSSKISTRTTTRSAQRSQQQPLAASIHNALFTPPPRPQPHGLSSSPPTPNPSLHILPQRSRPSHWRRPPNQDRSESNRRQLPTSSIPHLRPQPDRRGAPHLPHRILHFTVPMWTASEFNNAILVSGRWQLGT